MATTVFYRDNNVKSGGKYGCHCFTGKIMSNQVVSLVTTVLYEDKNVKSGGKYGYHCVLRG